LANPTRIGSPAAGREIAARRLEERRRSLSFKDGEFDTSTTIPAPVKASASPLSVMVFTPNEGEASNTLQLSWWRL